MNEKDLIYIAGFFDGEGSAYYSEPKAANGKRYPKITARLTQVDRTVLDWVANVFGFGGVYSKGDNGNPKWNECFDYSVNYRQARIFLTAIEPYLKVKRKKVSDLLDSAGRLYEGQAS